MSLIWMGLATAATEMDAANAAASGASTLRSMVYLSSRTRSHICVYKGGSSPGIRWNHALEICSIVRATGAAIVRNVWEGTKWTGPQDVAVCLALGRDDSFGR